MSISRSSTGDFADVLEQVPPEPISLVDHTESATSINDTARETNGRVEGKDGVWAKNVVIDEYQVIRGSTKAGAYVVFLIRIETYAGEPVRINRRYSEFDALRERLVKQFPQLVNEIPQLPPKSLIPRFSGPFLRDRQAKLQYFLLCILLNPQFVACKAVKEFVHH